MRKFALSRTLSTLCTIALLWSPAIFLSGTAQGGVWEQIKSSVNSVGSGTAGKEGSSNPSDAEVISGLREALSLGAKKAVSQASAQGGFWNNPQIRIPLPPQLQKISSIMKLAGLKSQADAFEESMNHAAEKASAKALPIFEKAIKDLTFQDLQGIWKGGDTAATDYFREKTSEPLAVAFKPDVHEAMQQVGVTRSYQNLTGNPLVSGLTENSNFDLDHYVTEKTIDGLFTLVGQEEKKIRTDPMARSTDLLKKVFGQLTN